MKMYYKAAEREDELGFYHMGTHSFITRGNKKILFFHRWVRVTVRVTVTGRVRGRARVRLGRVR